MGTPKERPAPLREKRVEVSLRGGELVIPFHFGRQPVASDAMRKRLDAHAVEGGKVVFPDWKEYNLSDAEILEELSVGGDHPLDKAPFYSLGLIISEEGFGRFDRPFKSLADPKLREVFRAIVDPLIDEPYYNPAQIARRALFRDNIVYPDSEKREWDAGELVSHLAIALAERGRIFDTNSDEHAPRISASYRWPADLAEMLGGAYLIGEGKIREQSKGRVMDKIKENLDRITHLGGLSEEDQAQIKAHANQLAGSEVLS